MSQETITAIREASRTLVRELGFMRPNLAGTPLPPSAVHALIEIGKRGSMTGAELSHVLNLEKSSVSRMVQRLVHTGKLRQTAGKQDGRLKLLSLTAKGRGTLAAIDSFAQHLVSSALDNLSMDAQTKVVAGLVAYSGALHARRTGTPLSAASDFTIETGYRPGLVGYCTEMQIRYYARTRGFGHVFESKVAAGLAEFVRRLDKPVNQFWTAVENGSAIGTVAIDGEDLGGDRAHLRWFIVDDGKRGRGLGKRLLNEAIGFCDQHGFCETHLWTVKGLDTARHLYEGVGFHLAEEHAGHGWGVENIEQLFVRSIAPCARAKRSTNS